MRTPPHILFVCTGNCCRSQMAEAILRHLGGDRFCALSAGSHPAGYIHPLAIAALENLGIPLGDLRSKSWREFEESPPDVVITVCDSAAEEVCPMLSGSEVTSHWSLPDPATTLAPNQERRQLADRVAATLYARISKLVEIPFDRLDPAEIKARLDALASVTV